MWGLQWRSKGGSDPPRAAVGPFRGSAKLGTHLKIWKGENILRIKKCL